MTREEAIERFENVKASALVQKASGVSEYWQGEIDGTIEAIDMAIYALTEPNKAVPPSLADVYKWERDIALLQLEEYGVGFAEKKRDDLVEVVRCKDCRWWEDVYRDGVKGYCHACKHGYHSPTWEIGIRRTTDPDFYCGDGERIEK